MPRWPIATLRDRLFSKIKRGQESECWPWTGAVNDKGYGLVNIGGRSKLAHRVVWATENGDVPVGQSVLHRCDVRPCVNPAHLFIGDQAANIADAVSKHRIKSKLTADQVLEIRALYATWKFTQQELAERFGVKQPQISQIVRRGSWKHLPRE